MHVDTVMINKYKHIKTIYMYTGTTSNVNKAESININVH